MKIIVAVDANIILSALLGGKPSKILFDEKFQFITTQFTIEEVKKYLPSLEKKLGVPNRRLVSFLNKLPLQVYDRDFYQDKIKKSQKMIAQIDKKDIEILALALKFKTFLWSQDKHFEEVKKTKEKVSTLKTQDFF